MLGTDFVVLQVPMFEGMSLDPFTFVYDGGRSTESIHREAFHCRM